MNQNILLFAEQRDGVVQKISYELIGGAKKLAAGADRQVIALLAGFFEPAALTEAAKKLIQSGADLVYTVNHPVLSEYTPAAYIEVLTKAAENLSPSILLIGSTTIGIDMAPEVSLRLGAGLVNNCTCFTIDEKSGSIIMERPGTDGMSVDIFECPHSRPAMATVRPGVLFPLTATERKLNKSKGNIQELTFIPPSCRGGELINVQKGRKAAADITEAKVLVAGGRGIGGSKGLYMLKKIAAMLGGGIACSRACVEAGWIDAALQVGQTGKIVRPELYLACGISGAFHHVSGMKDSKLIIAINKNPAAPIFNIADLGIVGSVEHVLPALIAALEKE